MRLEITDTEFFTVRVFLSERNLKALLAKLNGSPKDSACELMYQSSAGWLFVKAESDAEHYANPERDSARAGTLHPDTEQAIKNDGPIGSVGLTENGGNLGAF